MSISYYELNSRLKEIKTLRKEYLLIKGNTINNLSLSLNKNQNKEIFEKSNDDLKEIDQQIEALSSILSTSINIAVSIISPIQEKKYILNNINSTINILIIEKSIKDLLDKLDQESMIEKKIQIILEANNFINNNSLIFEKYREQFIQKSLDVLSYLKTNYLSIKSKININNEKECLELINEMDKNVVLNYKLSNNNKEILSFFTFLSNFISETCCTKIQLNEIQMKVDNFQKSTKKNDIINIINDIKMLIQKIFKKISQNIQERQANYILLNNNKLDNGHTPIFLLLIGKLIKGNESLINSLLKLIIKISKFLCEDNSEYIDLICSDCSYLLSSCEKFKFYILTLVSKTKELFNYIENSNTNDIDTFFIKFNSILYDIGEQYCNNEINFMKTKIINLFEDESKAFNSLIELHLNSNFDDLSSNILNCIEDSFYILKMSGERAISTLNLQMALAIINNIKDIISEDIFILLDIKITAILIKSNTSINTNKKYIFLNKNIKYKCNAEPSLSYNNTLGNFFLISCLNSIAQAKENIPILFQTLKELINNEIIHSKIFDVNSINLGMNDNKLNNINQSYFKANEIEMINISFSEENFISKKYDELILKKLKLSFEYLYTNINTTVDILNSINYSIDQTNIVNAEMSASFSRLFIDETSKLLRQWKKQLSECGYGKFIEYYSDYVASYMEKVLKRKNYSSYGVILLQKDINKIANFFQDDLLLLVRDKFNRLFYFVKVLNFETSEELKEYLRKYDDIKLKNEEIEQIRMLKKNL